MRSTAMGNERAEEEGDNDCITTEREREKWEDSEAAERKKKKKSKTTRTTNLSDLSVLTAADRTCDID